MRVTKQNVGTFAAAAEEFFSKMPSTRDADSFREDVLMMGAGDEIVCLLTPDELVGNVTACGRGNEVSFDEAVAAFLKSKGVQQVLVGMAHDPDGFDDMYVCGGAVPIPFGPDSEALSNMIAELGGSWRDDGCQVAGWSTYESE